VTVFIVFPRRLRHSAPPMRSNWRELEKQIGRGFKERGFTVTGFGGSAGGTDLALTRDGQRFLVQCKHWRKQEVNAAAVRELAEMLRTVGARGGYVITTGRFSREARELALKLRIQLIDGEGLNEFIASPEMS
jgi:restriction system protein